MPCMILTGYPCSGKTRLAELIQKRVRHRYANRIRKVVIINESSACSGSTIGQCYETAWNEKQTRGALKSSFDRAVGAHGDDTLIILDSTNYIKGFRYELYCISKAAGTAHCVVWCINDGTTVAEWNEKRRKKQQNQQQTLDTYSDEQLQALIQRYEPPDERNRWDRPLYQIDMRPVPQKALDQAASAVLTSSVYNMHNLSQVLTVFSTTLEKRQEEEEGSGKDIAPKSVASSTFKRANFKKPHHTQTTRSAATPSSTLTADALLALDSEYKETMQSSYQSLGDTFPLERSVGPLERPLKKDVSTAQRQEPTTIEDRVDQILEMFLCNVKPLTEGTSTRQHVPSDANVLHQVDSITQKICSSVWEAQNKSATGIGRIPILWDDGTLYLESSKRWQLAELRSFQRQFLQWILTHPPQDVSARGIVDHFLAYIATHR